MLVLGCYILSSPQINNGPFCFDCEGRRKRKELVRKKNKANEKDKRKREGVGKSNKTVHQMLIICFNGMGWMKERKDWFGLFV